MAINKAMYIPFLIFKPNLEIGISHFHSYFIPLNHFGILIVEGYISLHGSCGTCLMIQYNGIIMHLMYLKISLERGERMENNLSAYFGKQRCFHYTESICYSLWLA